MRKLIVALVVLGSLWLVGELLAPGVTERMVEERVRDRNPDITEVEANIDSFPLVTRLLLTGELKHASVTLSHVVRGDVTFDRVRFELFGLELDRAAMLRRDTRVLAIDHGEVEAEIDVGALGGVAGRAVRLARRSVRVEGNTLMVGPAVFRIASDAVPCRPNARVDGDRVVLSCSFGEVPQILLYHWQSD